MTTPTRREVPWALAILVFIALLNLFAIGLQIIVLNPAAQDNRNDISALVAQQHISDLEGCARNNHARVVSIHNLRGDVKTLKAQLRLWEAALAATTPQATASSPPAVLEAFTANIEALRQGISHKEKSVRSTIAAQKTVAIHPGSPVVACHRAYPS